MNEARICVSWDSYLNHVSKGFSHLQQNAEFVDMTLAADGHLVKVHQNIVALASPYLKAMLQSASCHHPVIFLNNVSHKILCYILEYIYTGEVQIPSNMTDKFIEACKSLCINGVNNINEPKNMPEKQSEPSIESAKKPTDNEFAALITITSQDHNYNLELENNLNHNKDTDPPISVSPTPVVGEMDYDAACDNNIDLNSISNFIILKPKTSSCNDILNTKNEDKQIKILSSTTINADHWQIKTNSTQNKFDTTISKPAEIILDANDLQFKSSQGSLNDMSSTHSGNITLDSTDLQFKPSQEGINDIASAHPVKFTLDAGDLQFKSSQESLNDIASAHPVKFTLDAGDLQFEIDQKSLNANPSMHPGNIGLNNNDSLEPSHSKVESETNLLNTKDFKGNSSNLNDKTDCGRRMNKNIKKIRSIIRLNKNQGNKTALINLTKSDIIKMDGTTHFTISNRGSIQMLLNRFLYHSHHHSDCGRKRRWRCIDYRKIHCPAYIDTNNDDVIAMEENHCHPNHDNIIRKKARDNIIFTKMTTAVKTINTHFKKNRNSLI